ncbi:unnamed protein product [Symbiodinium necroappetens]|uniref:Uncharacterized protein n=1 Tax=Symbiodinium necroappetens TaxID=1628268 RepID=A0A812TV20_9DINO|nr:unnamed protein product [Symbiodinium necroappetens]
MSQPKMPKAGAKRTVCKPQCSEYLCTFAWRAIALSLGTPPSYIVRLLVVSKMPEGVDPEQATSHIVEWEMEVRLSEEHGFLEVSSKLEAVADVLAALAQLSCLVFRAVLFSS